MKIEKLMDVVDGYMFALLFPMMKNIVTSIW